MKIKIDYIINILFVAIAFIFILSIVTPLAMTVTVTICKRADNINNKVGSKIITIDNNADAWLWNDKVKTSTKLSYTQLEQLEKSLDKK